MDKTFRVFEDISELLTLRAAARKSGRRITEADLSLIHDAAVVESGGAIAWVGERAGLPDEFKTASPISLGGRVVLPAFVEPHTHLVFAGNRAHEFEWRVQGQSYQEISAKGGGILSTVRATRAASAEDLLKAAQARADRFVSQGVTLLEIKSGYGLDLETERRSLQIAREISGPEVVTTYLGPHSRSPDHADLGAFMRQICESVLPTLHSEGLVDRADIYIEKGFFGLELARLYFEAVQKLGIPITAHVEQLSEFGGTDLALRFSPQSVDHLVYISESTIQLLAGEEATAVLLPASDFYLKMKYPPARALIDAGARVALSTDFNPGTSPTQDLSLVGVLARLEMKMSLPEVLAAFTVGGAHALGRQNQYGSLEVGKRCDFITIDGHWRELFYSVGHHPVHQVWKSGRLIS